MFFYLKIFENAYQNLGLSLKFVDPNKKAEAEAYIGRCLGKASSGLGKAWWGLVGTWHSSGQQILRNVQI